MRPSKMSESRRTEPQVGGSHRDFLHSQKHLAYDECFEPIQMGTLVETETDQLDTKQVIVVNNVGGDLNLEMEENSQVFTVNDRELFGFQLGMGPNNQRSLKRHSAAINSLPELDPSQLNLSEGRGNPLFDTINSDQGNTYWNADATLGGLGSELPLSQQSFGFSSIDKYLNDTDANKDIEPMGNENICFQQFLGIYGFKVTPIETGKCVFTEEHNKFFCTLGTYEFNIMVDFDSMSNPEKFAIRAALIYTDPEHQSKPVIKCINCAETQKKIMDEETKDVLYHIVRGNFDDKHLTYERSDRTGFCYTIIGLREPELGSKTLLQKLAFTCRSSCRSNEELGINRRSTALVFTLLDHRKQICGRSVVNVRICSAPSRDFKNEFGEGPGPVQPKKKRKQATAMAAPPAKVRTEVQLNAYNNDGRIPIPSTSRTTNELQVQAKTVNPFDLDKTVDVLCQNSSQEGSQESIIEYEGEEEGGPRRSIKLRSLSMQCKRVLQWINCNDPIQRAAAMQVFESLKFTERVCSASSNIIKEAQDRRNAGQGDYN